MKTTQLFQKAIFAIYILVGLLGASCTNSPEIVVQNFKMQVPEGESIFTEDLLVGEIAETKITHVAYRGPLKQNIELEDGVINMLIFIAGNAQLIADSVSHQITPESIAIPFGSSDKLLIDVPVGEELHFIQFAKTLSSQDLEDMKNFPEENKYDLFFTRFDDCEPYTEKIKSPNTVSRTVLPADIIPRVALGTVEAPGPDEVGAHSHAMLDQLFLGLSNNDVVVHADKATASFTEFSLLHIPIGSSHWVTVDENKKMYYMWMDFFLTKEGQEWLKTHKPISTDKNDY